MRVSINIGYLDGDAGDNDNVGAPKSVESFFVPMYESYSKRKDSKSLAGSPMSEQRT